MSRSIRRWVAIGMTGMALGIILLFGNVAVSADAGIAGKIVPTACTLNGQCPKQDEFKAGTPDATTGDVSTDDASNNSEDDTTSPGDSGTPAG